MSEVITNVVWGWLSPRLWIDKEVDDRKESVMFALLASKYKKKSLIVLSATRLLAPLVAIGFLKWAHVCLRPRYARDKNGWGVGFLGFYLNVIRGPYKCHRCGRATTQEPDLEHNIASHCSRAACALEPA